MGAKKQKPRGARLAGWYVISLRPVGAHAPVRRAAAALGARVVACSPLRLAAEPGAAAALREVLAAERVIFTSPAAVRFAASHGPLRPRARSRWYAVGAGTAAALRRRGVPRVETPERMDSEGLLALPGLAAVRGLRVGLVTAPGGRGLIAATLSQRGAQVQAARIYRREAVRLAPAARTRLSALPSPRALLVSSAEAFDAWWSQMDAATRPHMRMAVVIASSARLADSLRAHGFRDVAVAASARPRTMLERLAEHAASAPFG